MKELRDIVRAYAPIATAKREAVLATVIATRGSTYRKAGARMLVTEDGWAAGAISGGCIERDLLRKAWWRTAASGAVVVTYSGAREDEARGFGLGCDGSVDILLERVRHDAPAHPIAFLARCIDERVDGATSTVVRVEGRTSAKVGQRVNVTNGHIAGASVDERLIGLVASSEGRVVDGDGAFEVVREIVLPPKPLVIFGGNHDVAPVAELATSLGWDVTVVAPRTAPSLARAVDRVVIGRAPEVTSSITVDARTAIVLMTHDYDEDCALLAGLARTRPEYVGILGPARRAARIFSDLARDGVPIDPSFRARVHAPIGLDLGGRSPEEIALSIVAEVQAWSNARPARSLGAYTPPHDFQAIGAREGAR